MSVIKIRTKKKTNEISPILYGAFFEDINYGGDGGLYAELVANRSFEYYDRDGVIDKSKMCWESLIGTKFEIHTEKPINNVHTHYASVCGSDGTGIRNTGFCGEGFAARENEKFNFSCYARSDGDIKLTAVISDRTQRELGHTEFVCASREWSKYEFEITAEKSCVNAYLSVELTEGGSVDLEFISLFPKETFCGRKNGMRKDIAEMIAEMKPKFMRFPGGCIVEGRSFDNMYNWKDTIGAVEERKTNWNRWQHEDYRNLGYNSDDYFQSYGIGFFEYFQFCEDIGAKPVPVINCGMTCQWHEAKLVDMDKLEPFVQDAFDLIEFANGREDSKWGRKRAEMGHTAPFKLEYIGIGNEQWGNEYFERYEIFQREITKKYPYIRLITSAGWKDRGWEFEFAYDWMDKNKQKAYAVDEHFYKEPEWFLKNTERYDNYDRSLPKVFIGEWAAHTEGEIKRNKNNWHAALCEAAFLTGVEKNSDHVVMTCYAPLLARVNHNQWQPDLIWFDNEKVYGTPSYYVQKLFSEYIGDFAVETYCDDTDLKVTASMKEGSLILKVVNLSAECKKIAVEIDEVFNGQCCFMSISSELNLENTLQKSENICTDIETLDWNGKLNLNPYSVNVAEVYKNI